MVYMLTWLVAGGADETAMAAGLGVRGEVSESATDPPQSRTGSAPLDDSPFSISTTVLTSLSIELSDSIFGAGNGKCSKQLKQKFRRSGRIGVRRGTATSKRPLFREVTDRGGAVTAGGGASRDVTCRRPPMSAEPAADRAPAPVEGRSLGSAPLRPKANRWSRVGNCQFSEWGY
jgi:hypothetical protein